MANQNNHSTDTILLRASDSFMPRIEEPSAIAESVYSPIYLEALQLTQKVVKNTESLIEKQKKGLEISAFSGENDFNNIIAFTGGRGSGKTSTMISFQRFLTDGGHFDYLGSGRQELERFRWPTFYATDTVDPAAFEGKERIIEVIVSHLYQRFKSIMEDSDRRKALGVDLPQKTLSAFDSVLRALRMIRHPELALRDDAVGNDMLLERLDSLGTASTLKKSLEKLVECVLGILNYKKTESSFLIIAIDDADLNLENGVELLEDLRKYLRLPRLLILMSMRQEQIMANIAKEFKRQYDGLPTGQQFDDPRIMADAYLRKLIPENSRLAMPFSNLRAKANQIKLQLEGFDFKLDGSPTVTEAVKELVRRKLAFTLWTEVSLTTHPFIPDSLREMHDLFSELSRWDDFPKELRRLPTYDNNEKFISFLTNGWSVGKIAADLRRFLLEMQEVELGNLSKFIISKVKLVIDSYLSKQSNNQIIGSKSGLWDPSHDKLRVPVKRMFLTQVFEQMAPLFEIEGKAENVGPGEVMVLLRLIDDNYVVEEITCFTFLVRAIYSMRFFSVLKNPQNRASRYIDLLGCYPIPPEAIAPEFATFGNQSTVVPSQLIKRFDVFYGSIRSQLAVLWKDYHLNNSDSSMESDSGLSSEGIAYLEAWAAVSMMLIWVPISAPVRVASGHGMRKMLMVEPARPFPTKTNIEMQFSIIELFRKLYIESIYWRNIKVFPQGWPKAMDTFSKDWADDQKDWLSSGLPNFPIWDLEGLEEAITRMINVYLERWFNDSPLEIAILSFISVWDSIIEGYNNNVFLKDTVAETKQSDERKPKPIKCLKFADHFLFKNIAVSTPSNEKIKRSRQAFSEVVTLMLEYTQADQNIGPAKMRTDAIPRVERLLASNSKDTTYRRTLADVIYTVRESRFPITSQKEQRVVELDSILKEWDSADRNGKRNLTKAQRQVFARRVLDILKQLSD